MRIGRIVPVAGSKTAFIPPYLQLITKKVHFKMLTLFERLLLVKCHVWTFCRRLSKDNETFK